MSLAIWIALFYIGNLLDVLSTYFGMRGYTKKQMQERELNPIMSKFIHNKKASYAFKFGICSLIVVLVVRNPGTLIFLELFTILIFLVVGQNLLATFLTKRKKLSFGKFLTDKLKFPKFLAYLTILGVLLFASVGIWMLL